MRQKRIPPLLIIEPMNAQKIDPKRVYTTEKITQWQFL
nr:no significant similarity found [uncultured bacterium]